MTLPKVAPKLLFNCDNGVCPLSAFPNPPKVFFCNGGGGAQNWKGGTHLWQASTTLDPPLPQGGGRGVKPKRNPPTNHQTQHAPLKVGANRFIHHLHSLHNTMSNAEECIVTQCSPHTQFSSPFFTLFMRCRDFKCSCMALAWLEMCMLHLHKLVMLTEQNGSKAKWDQKCNTEVTYGLDQTIA